MEQELISPPAGEQIDEDTFLRVWERVMPDQTDSPIEVERRNRKSVPLCSSEQVPPTVPPCVTNPKPPEVCPCPEQPSQPEVPRCSAEGIPYGVPPCARTRESPSSDASCPCTKESPLCLGEKSRGDMRRLEELMSMAQRGTLAGQILTRRSAGACSRGMASLTKDHRLAFRRLSAAYFLITGKRFRPACPPPELPYSLGLALREQFMWEQRWEYCNRQAAEATEDPCLKALYEELGEQGAVHAGIIRSLLEQMT